jgi:hypothetical protein
MKKLFLAMIMTVGLIGCTEYRPYEITDKSKLPEGLMDCAVYSTGYGTVVRCPNSSTSLSYMSGKVQVHTNVIDTPVVYVPKYDTIVSIVPHKK